jgi:hypothetical protein
MWIALACCIAAVGVTVRETWWHLHPDQAFAHYTGHAVPPGLRATHYGRSIDDNLFHVGHYWILRGRRENIANFAQAHDFVESTEDARWRDSHAQELFGVDFPAKRIVAGYERDQGRNDWILVYAGDIAIYNEE